MRNEQNTKPDPAKEAAQLRRRVRELEKAETKWQRAEMALRAAEMRYRNLVENAPEPIMIVGGTKIVYVNAAALRLLGFSSPEQVVGQPVLRFVQPPYHGAVKRRIAEVKKGHTVPLMEQLGYRLDGSTVHVEVAGAPIVDGGKTFVLGMFRDITERKQAEQAAQERQATIRRITDNMLDLVSEVDAGGVIRYASPSHRKVLGYDPDDLVGTSVYRLVHPEDVEALEQAGNRAVRDRKPMVAESRVRHSDGRYVWLEAVGNPIFDKKGRFVAAIFGSRDITARKRAEEALRDSERRYRELADALPQPVFEADAKARLTFANRSALETFRYSRDDLERGINIADTVAPLDRRRADKNIRRVLKGETFSDDEYLMMRKDGGTFPALVYARPIMRDDRAVGLRGIVVDITDRKEAEAMVQTQLRFLEDLLNAIPLPVFYKNVKGLYIGCNPAFEKYLGLPKERIVDKAVYDVAPRELADIYRRADEALFREGGTQVYEAQVQHSDGTRHDVVFYKAPFHTPDGRIAGLVGTILDITERKQMETALTVSEQRYRSLFETALDAIIVTDQQGRIVDANPQASALTGYPRGSLLNMSWPDIIPEDRREAARRSFAQLKREGAMRGETTALRKDGSTLEIAFAAARAGPELYQIVILDISEKKRAARLAFVQEYVSLISHDLRNPLTVVAGQAEYLRNALIKRDLDREAKSAESIFKSAQRMNTMIQDLVESARLEAGAQPMHRQPIDLASLVFDLVERVGTMKEQLRIRVERLARLPKVAADPGHIERAVANLVSNALKYSPPTSPVIVRVGRTDDEAIVSVTDYGVGIPAEDIPHLFERFYRAKTGREAAGLGLGLYITRLIVEAHGGRIWVESQVGKGSTFYFTLPLGPKRRPSASR
ncbi:MAG: PAS domain S-box protein [Chloroflexota bacterium]